MNLETIVFENNTLRIIDQTKLPSQFRYLTLNTLDDVIDAIKGLKVRGAPAIGVTAAYGLYIHARNLRLSRSLNKTVFLQACINLKSARPTAVNLSWAVEQMVQVFLNHLSATERELISALKKQAVHIHQVDRRTCAQIGKYGAELLPKTANVLTHCNAGILATGGNGTALSVVYSAAKTKTVHVYVDETRPVGQGARLTYWELEQNRIPATLITDNMAAMLMQQKKIDAVIVGADRIAKNGDVANKIGTYGLAVLANYHRIPFWVAAPVSSFDFSIEEGKDIPIEFRKREEVLDFWGIDSESYKVFNPAFDITPNELISAIITENGVLDKPFKEKIIQLSTY
jgi:methylthioribose-1-phosphate isomerase